MNAFIHWSICGYDETSILYEKEYDIIVITNDAAFVIVISEF